MKKLGILLLALVIALGSLGVGYAKWSDNVTIHGQVTSGTVCLKWDAGTNIDPCDSNSNDPKYDPDSLEVTPRWEKNVACTDMVYTDATRKTIRVTIHNAYPGYFFDTQLEYTNCGTIPVIVDGLSIIADNFTISNDLDWTKNTPGEIFIEWRNTESVGQQLHPGKTVVTSLWVLVRQSAVQDEDYTFTVTLNGSQWNEAVPTPTVISPVVH